jgi:BirA family biotin operon repressor/biotin-[acetyl-CoA-carboxylase] ligase
MKNLRTKFVGRCYYRYDELPTTMEVARRLAREGALEGTVVIADVQTAGRGRLGRSWLSPHGSLAMSIILRPSFDHLPYMIMIASLAVVRAVEQITGLGCSIKWPNDVLIGSKKLSGILIESEMSQGVVNYAIVGIGVNVNIDPSVFPEISKIATSLSCEFGQEVDRDEFTCALLLELEQLYLSLQAGGCSSVYREWKEYLETLGKDVTVKCGEQVERGMAEDVTEKGSLLLRRADGSLIEIMTGDVTIVKE